MSSNDGDVDGKKGGRCTAAKATTKKPANETAKATTKKPARGTAKSCARPSTKTSTKATKKTVGADAIDVGPKRKRAQRKPKVVGKEIEGKEVEGKEVVGATPAISVDDDQESVAAPVEDGADVDKSVTRDIRSGDTNKIRGPGESNADCVKKNGSVEVRKWNVEKLLDNIKLLHTDDHWFAMKYICGYIQAVDPSFYLDRITKNRTIPLPQKSAFFALIMSNHSINTPQ